MEKVHVDGANVGSFNDGGHTPLLFHDMRSDALPITLKTASTLLQR